ncbi:hypothetical protein Tco_1407189 [Tanacetum coccineum]
MYVGFDEDKCYIQDLKKEKILGTGCESGVLYMFGHPANQVLFALHGDLKIFKSSFMSVCEVCHRAKQTRDPFPLPTHKSKALGKFVHLDLWGPYRVLAEKAEYGVSTSIGYGVSNSLSNTAYSFKLINTTYPLPLDMAYRSSGTETEILVVTRSSTNELFTPYKEPEREFRSSRRHFKTLSLDELRSPNFNLLSDQEYSEEEEAEAMAETMEQYMSKTRTDYGSGVARPKIDNKDQFELKGQFLKELRENTFSGSDNEDANEHIEKVLEIQELDETLYQAWERFKELLMKCPQHYLTEMQEVILFYNGLDVPTRQILDSRGVVPTKTAEDAKKAIQEMAEYS